MKKIFYLLVFAILLVACEKEKDIICGDSKGDELVIGLEEAIALANTAPMQFSDYSTRSGSYKSVDKSKIELIIASTTRSAADTLMYVINYKNAEGFAIISHKRINSPILVYAEQGTYLPNSTSKISGFEEYLESAKQYLSDIEIDGMSESKIGINPDPSLYEYKTDVTERNDTVLPQIKVEWGQQGIYGSFCPNGIAGCSNTGIAMAMSHFEYPKQLSLSFPDKPATSVNLNWKSIKKHTSQDYYSSNPGDYGTWSETSSLDSHGCKKSDWLAIGCLMRELGHRSNSDYSKSDGTSTPFSKTHATLKGLGFNVTDIADYKSCCGRAVSENALMIMCGTNDDGTHLWMIDGYRYHEYLAIKWRKYKYSYAWEEVSSYSYNKIYYHCNWGWNGMYNGYYQELKGDGYKIDTYHKNLKYFIMSKG
ncbi:MAG: C10 family peptidase [Muribaculaceae bacterium]|nr:C10 family peptidase [Muribaculaceae bacterium]